MAQVVSWILLLVAFVLPYNTVYSDPCTNNKAINDPYRSSAYKRGTYEVAICDNLLLPGWYRFTSVVGGRMPTTKPEPHFCGTVAPIWMRGTHPTTKGQVLNVTACINYYNRDHGCKFRMTISVKNCGSFFVYKLKPSRGCSMAYCAGNLLPCPKGQIGIAPNCTVSVVMPFPFHLVPTPNITALAHDNHEASLRCNFDFPLWKNVSFYVEWFADGRSISNDTSICENQNPDGDAPPCSQRHTEIRTRDNYFRAGHRIRCRLRMKYTTSTKNKWTTLWRDSDYFNVGIEVIPSRIVISVKECEKTTTKVVSFRPTIPVLPERHSGMDYVPVDIYIPSKFLNQDRQSAVDSCHLRMKGTETKKIKIKGICDNQDDPANSVLEYHFGIVNTHPFWGLYRLPSLRVSVHNTERRMCQSRNDPHYYTFDNRGYGAMDTGDHVLFRDRRRNTEIHSRVWLCSQNTGSCNCGVAIREGNDVIVLTLCDSLRTFHRPNKLRVHIRSTGPLARGLHISRKKQSGDVMRFKVLLPSGILVEAKRLVWGINIAIYAFRDTTSGNIEGLCGNFNGNQADDFNNGGDKQNHADADSFTRSWRISSRSSYFEALPAVRPVSETGQSCFCPVGKTTHDVKDCKDTAAHFEDFNIHQTDFEDITASTQRTERSVRENIYTDDIIEYEERSFFKDSHDAKYAEARIRSKRQIEERDRMSKENATMYCKRIIEDSIGGKTCRNLVGTNLTVFVMECIEDLTMTGDINFAQSAFDSMKDGCEDEALRNVSLYKKDSSGNLRPPEEIGSVLCPNDCSNHGNCTNRTCICEEGFTAPDCSMAVNTIPELLGIYNGGLCDIRRRPCRKTDIFGQDFLDSENLTCHAQEFKVMTGNWRPKTYTMKFPGKKVDLFAVKCNLPEPPTKLGDYDHEGTPVGGLLISVLNDGEHPSQHQMRFVSYDSICIRCNKSSNCSLRDDACVINGHCFANNQGNPRNWCLKCMPGNSQYRWTLRPDNGPPQFAKNQSTRYAIYGEYLPLQLKATDPNNRPVKYSLISSTATGYTFTSTGLLTWKANSRTNRKFEFKVTDECNASDTITITIRIVTCPCQNGGTCSPHPYFPRGSGQYSCTCPRGFTGDRCETNIDDCVGVNCGNGTCVDGVNKYMCRCHVGFAGSLCEQRLTRCTNQACFPGVTCTEIPTGISCGPCPVGFSGDGKTCVALTTTGRPTTTAQPTTTQSTTTKQAQPTTIKSTKTSQPTTENEETTAPVTDETPVTTQFRTSSFPPTTEQAAITTDVPEMQVTRAEIYILRKWTEEYERKTSIAYIALKRSLENEIENVFRKAKKIYFKSVTVTSMRPGSIIVEFQIIFTRKTADPLLPLKEEITDGTLGHLEVNPTSLKIKEEYPYRDKKAPEKENNLLLILVIVLICLVGTAFLVAVAVIAYRKLHRQPAINPNQLPYLSNVELNEMDACPNAYDNVTDECKEKDTSSNTYESVDERKVKDRTSPHTYDNLQGPKVIDQGASPHTYESVGELKVTDRCAHAYDNVHFQTFEQEKKSKDFS